MPNQLQTNSNNFLSRLKNMNDDFVYYMIISFTLFLVILIISYLIYLTNLQSKQCSFMDKLYSSLNTNIISIRSNDKEYSYNLNDYFIKTAYNACSGGTYKNDFVNICNLKNILKQGVRCIDFEIYSVGNNPVVSTSTVDEYYIKETYNYVDFSEVMQVVVNYAFSSSTSPNHQDPIIIHLRIKSNNQVMYSKLANIFKSYERNMLGKEYSFENHGENIGNKPLKAFMGKIILIIDKTNSSFLENKDLLEFVNLTSNSVFMRAYKYYNVKNNPDINELQEYNKKNMTIVLPDNDSGNPANPSGLLARDSGCQMIAMRYQYIDSNLNENNAFFNKNRSAFCLKPEHLRYKVVTIAPPVKQNPNLSYATRTVSTDYYSFKY